MRKKIITVFLVLALLLGTYGTTGMAQSSDRCKPGVVITDMGSHYEVTADMDRIGSHRLFGEEYGQAIKQALPEFEALVDTYLARLAAFLSAYYGMSPGDVYSKMVLNAKDIYPQVDKKYRWEIEGLASEFSEESENVPGDGKVSFDEMVVFNLLPDAIRVYECSAAAVFGDRSETGKTIVARNLDWIDLGIFSKIQSVLTIKDGSKSICLVGGLGNLGAISAFNRSGVFGAILDTSMSNAKPVQSMGKRSYYMDLRHAIENETSLEGVANYMKDSKKQYIYNHLIFLADKKSSKVLENNMSGEGTNMRRALRSWDSELNEGITWNIPNAIGCVNCFMLKGNHDDYTNVITNTSRWESLKRELAAKGDKVNAQELQDVISYSHYDGPGVKAEGDLYWGNDMMGAAQAVIFIPGTKELKVFFRPRDSKLPNQRVFETVTVSFGS